MIRHVSGKDVTRLAFEGIPPAGKAADGVSTLGVMTVLRNGVR